MVRTHHLPLRFLIVSRPESRLEETFEEQDLANITKVLSLYSDYWASSDVSMYLQSEFISSRTCNQVWGLLHLRLYSYQIHRRGILRTRSNSRHFKFLFGTEPLCRT